jgi:hypothetical protein
MNPDLARRSLRRLFPTSSSSSPTASRTPMRARLRTQAGDTASRQAKGLVGDQALVVEVGRLELRPTS